MDDPARRPLCSCGTTPVNAETMRVGWHAKSYDPTMASIRVRLLEPMAYLQERGRSMGGGTN